jgi:putative phosphoribosyl transferase
LPLPHSDNATLILCTDGIQTGQDARNTIAILKKFLNYRGKIILVGGVIGPDAQKMFSREIDEVIAVRNPQIVGTVDAWFGDIVKLTNEEVQEILSNAKDLSN